MADSLADQVPQHSVPPTAAELEKQGHSNVQVDKRPKFRWNDAMAKALIKVWGDMYYKYGKNGWKLNGAFLEMAQTLHSLEPFREVWFVDYLRNSEGRVCTAPQEDWDAICKQLQYKKNALWKDWKECRTKEGRSGEGAVQKCPFYDELATFLASSPASGAPVPNSADPLGDALKGASAGVRNTVNVELNSELEDYSATNETTPAVQQAPHAAQTMAGVNPVGDHLPNTTPASVTTGVNDAYERLKVSLQGRPNKKRTAVTTGQSARDEPLNDSATSPSKNLNFEDPSHGIPVQNGSGSGSIPEIGKTPASTKADSKGGAHKRKSPEVEVKSEVLAGLQSCLLAHSEKSTAAFTTVADKIINMLNKRFESEEARYKHESEMMDKKIRLAELEARK